MAVVVGIACHAVRDRARNADVVDGVKGELSCAAGANSSIDIAA